MDQLPKKLSQEIRKDPMDFASELEDSDSGVAASYEAFKKTLEKLGLDLLKCKVLEVGSGNGTFLDYLNKKGGEAVGVDARPRGKSVISARIEQLPFNNESFGVVLSRSAVFDETMYDQDHTLMMKEIARVLKHGGVFIGLYETISVPPIEGFNLIPAASLDSLGYKGGLESVYKKS